jgi:predicted DNA-binding transcriptional regulator YafY
MTETSGRLLKLLSLLQTRRDWPGGELAERLGVSGRTIRRDVERLRELGYPVDAVTGPAGGYRLHAGTAMPPLLLDDDEAVAIAVGLRTAAGASVTGIEETSIRALVKLEQVLPSHLRRRVNALSSVLATLPASGPMVDPEALTTIAGACRDRERLRFAYRTRDAQESRRHVEPHSLVNLGRRWYLVAWDCDRTGWRTFRVDRLELRAARAARRRSRRVRRVEPAGRALALPGARHRAGARRRARAPPVPVGHRRGSRRGRLRVPHERRLAGLAGHADRHARRRVRGPRAARARGALRTARRAFRAGGQVNRG